MATSLRAGQGWSSTLPLTDYIFLDMGSDLFGLNSFLWKMGLIILPDSQGHCQQDGVPNTAPGYSQWSIPNNLILFSLTGCIHVPTLIFIHTKTIKQSSWFTSWRSQEKMLPLLLNQLLVSTETNSHYVLWFLLDCGLLSSLVHMLGGNSEAKG